MTRAAPITPLDPITVPLTGLHLIEASAGTGKTHTVSTLYVRLLLELQRPVGEILVVTYTNAATAELRTRIRGRLHAALAALDGAAGSGDADLDRLLQTRRAQRRGVPDRARDRALLLAALYGFDEAAIFTIHGFCQRMLHDNAFESGVAFDTELITNEHPVLTEVVRDFWTRELYAASAVFVRYLHDTGVTLSTLERLAAQAITHPEITMLPARVDIGAELAAASDVWSQAHEAAAEIWETERDAVLQLLSANGAPSLQAIHGKWAAFMDVELAAPRPGITRRSASRKFTTDVLQRFARRPALPPTHPFFAACERLYAADAALERVLSARHLQLQLNLIDYTRSELRRRKAALRVQSFDDLLQQLAAALRAPEGAALGRAIRARFPAALIDEFQDTDPLQYDIFRRVYQDRDATLFLIGDPKQAIYAFRGADVFTYLQAKRAAPGRVSTLETNWRSSPSLIRGVNSLFGRTRAAFALDEIAFRAAVPAPCAADRLDGPAAGEAPLQILFVRRTGQEGRDGHINKQWAESQLSIAMANEIARFLARRVTIAGQEVVPADIAVLCRKNREARAMQTALAALGIPSVLQTEASVFDTPEAVDVERVLRAVADPGDARAVRAALASTLLGLNANELCALQHDEQAWDTWVERFQEWHELWLRCGFVVAFRSLLQTQGVACRFLAQPEGERQLTNVLHLMELLHATSTEERRGPLALVHWLGQMRVDDAARVALGNEAEQLRLESDADAVRLVTVHKAKGLEYPIVFCPYLWDGMLLSQQDKRTPRFHDPDASNRLTLDLGSPALAQHRALAEREALAESLRLLYVALTRAQHRCTVVWGAFRDAETSALGYLLHQPASDDGDAGARAAGRIKALINSRDDDGMRADLEALAALSHGAISITDMSLAPAPAHVTPPQHERALRCRTPQRARLWLDWRTSSFSGLASSAEISQPAAEGLDHDETVAALVTEEAPASTASVTLHTFPAGARAGQLIHTVLQYLDFQHADPPALREQVATTLARFGYDAHWTEPLCRALSGVLDTSLDRTSLRLRKLAAHRRLNELEFLFPVADDGIYASTKAALSATRLAMLFRQHAAPPVPQDYADRLQRLGFAPLTGFLRGFIDLVFEHDARWYLVDYKSNFLGQRPRDYQPARLAAVMMDHHYILQYHVYVVALHRYLRLRLPGYDYDRHFGGVYYLFVRGMSPDHPPGSGIFADRPARALIEGFSALLEGRLEAR